MHQVPDPEIVCRAVLEAANHVRPPTDLDSVRGLWPRLALVEDDLDKEGYLVPLGIHGAELLIRRSDHIHRKRFTIAHELGHWVFAHVESGEIRFGDSPSSLVTLRIEHKWRDPEEIWCNQFAASLLMPRHDLGDYFREEEQAIARKVAEGHTVFRVSEEAFLQRVANSTTISVVEAIIAQSRARIRRQFISDIEPLEDPQAIVERLSEHYFQNGMVSGYIYADRNLKVYAHQVRKSHSDLTVLICAVPASKEIMP